MKRARKIKAIRNEARGTWVCFPKIDGKRTTRKLGMLKELTQVQADYRAEEMCRSLRLQAERTTPMVRAVVEKYRIERMPKRYSTNRGYECWLRNHIIPKWGDCALSEVQARPVDLWLQSLTLAPKSKAEIRGLLRILWEFAMWSEIVPTQRNPMELVKVKGATRRRRKPRSLTADEFQKFVRHLQEPFRTIAFGLCVLRPSHQRMPGAEAVRRGLAGQ